MARFRIISFPALLVSLLTMLGAVLILYGHSHLLFYGAQPLPYLIAQDSSAYVKIASGHLADVESPFSKRILYPYLVGVMANLTHLNLAQAFLAANFLCLGLLAYCVSACLDNTVARPFLALIPLFSAFGFESLSLAYLPDLFHAAFTALFFLLLLKDRWMLALLTLFFLCLARDNTFFLCAITAVVAYRRKNVDLMKGSLVVLVLGVIVSSLMARVGKPNVHHLWEPLYLALKVPYNFMANVFGVFFWTDVRSDVGTPLVTWPVPELLRHLGKDSRIGLVLSARQPLNTCIALLTIFGTGPLFLFYFRRKWKDLQMPLPIELTLVYGILSYFLGVALGNWVFRLVGYGWPAVWIALPFLLTQIGYRPPRWKCFVLLVCFWTVSWLPSLAQDTSLRWTLVLPLTAILYLITFACLSTSARDFHPAPGRKLER